MQTSEVESGIWISIHTTARVVTVFRQPFNDWDKNFNPHHRTGGDILKHPVHDPKYAISIHTTARVVTGDGYYNI